VGGNRPREQRGCAKRVRASSTLPSLRRRPPPLPSPAPLSAVPGPPSPAFSATANGATAKTTDLLTQPTSPADRLRTPRRGAPTSDASPAGGTGRLFLRRAGPDTLHRRHSCPRATGLGSSGACGGSRRGWTTARLLTTARPSRLAAFHQQEACWSSPSAEVELEGYQSFMSHPPRRGAVDSSARGVEGLTTTRRLATHLASSRRASGPAGRRGGLARHHTANGVSLWPRFGQGGNSAYGRLAWPAARPPGLLAQAGPRGVHSAGDPRRLDAATLSSPWGRSVSIHSLIPRRTRKPGLLPTYGGATPRQRPTLGRLQRITFGRRRRRLVTRYGRSTSCAIWRT